MSRLSIEQFHTINPKAAEAVADLLAVVGEFQPPQKSGWRGVMVSKFTGWGIPDHIRHAFTNDMFGVTSSNDLEPHTCRGICKWLDDGGYMIVNQIVKAAEDIRASQDGVVQAALAMGAEIVTEGDEPMSEESERTMSEWTSDAISGFWQYALIELELDRAEVLKALGGEIGKDYEGTKADAKAVVDKLAADKKIPPQEAPAPTPEPEPEPLEIDRSTFPEPVHTEAKTLFWSKMRDPQGVVWSVTLREGSNVGMVLDMAQMASEVSETLIEHGWRGTDGSYVPQQTLKKAAGTSPAPTSRPSSSPPPLSGVSTRGNGSGDGEYERLPVVKIAAQTTPNGSPMFKIKGGRLMKSGVTAWPEVAETLAGFLDGWDPTAEMNVGDEVDLSEHSLIALCEPPEAGRKWPGKVLEFAKA